MNLTQQQLWERFQKRFYHFPSIGLSLDLSRMNYADGFLSQMESKMKTSFEEMEALERGAIANRDENRMVGHYWLRNPALAPSAEITGEIEQTVEAVKAFAQKVHAGTVQGERGPFKNLLLIGIGGSALGPQFVSHALGHPLTDKLEMLFFDNTDPDGMDKVLARIVTELGQTLCLVISKSGGTKETRNGMLEAEAAWKRAGLRFSRHAVAVTGGGSNLDKQAIAGKWLARFPMWDWVGGRTSVTSAVGLLPAALQGLEVDAFLKGARECDELTRRSAISDNPASLMAAAWFYIGNGAGSRDMVVLPYKDRLELLSKYLQQLVMESLGKEVDRAGKVVNQGLAVYGNKGATDQHAYVQQLREGLNNFFAVFIEVHRCRNGTSELVEPDVTSGDYLFGYYWGTRQALFEKGRESVTISINRVSAYTVGVLIALFERTVGLYAALVNLNAYHQPGVEAGKKAADEVIDLKRRLLHGLRSSNSPLTVGDAAAAVGSRDLESVFKILEHIASNPEWGIVRIPGRSSFDSKYGTQ